MRVIINEIKKLLNVKSIIIVGIIGFVIWNIFIGRPYINYFPIGLPDVPHYNISSEMLDKYGTEIDEEEMKDFINDTKKLEKEGDEYLQKRDDAKAAGVKSYLDFYNKYQNDSTEEIEELHFKITFEENNELISELDERQYLIERYYDKEDWFELRRTEKNKERIDWVLENDISNSVLNFAIVRNYDWIISNFSMLIIITIAFIISTIFIKDKKNKMNYYQYTTKVGRRLTHKKIIAALVTSFLVVTIEIGILFFLYSQNGTLKFWDCSMNGIFSDYTLWFNLTFGEYIILSIILMYLLTFIITSITLFVGNKAKSYISLIGIQIPIMAVLIGGFKLFGLYEMTVVGGPKYFIHVLYISLFIISCILIGKIIKTEKTRNIIE
ncbi:MAG: hypothetical protein ACRCWM_08245 [Sarcina sp.]